MHSHTQRTKTELEAFSQKIDERLEAELEVFFNEIPYANHLTTQGEPLNTTYYIRHRIETILRIKLSSKPDALALAKMIDEDYDLARKWGKYAIQEMNHDKMFINDLKAHGLNEDDILATPAFESTLKLMNYLEHSIAENGALPAVLYSLFVEWNSDRYSHLAVAKAGKRFSATHVKGAKAHIDFDEKHNHYIQILEIAYLLVGSDAKKLDILNDIANYFRQYFLELYNFAVTESNIM